jgi:hypothetical protein
MPYGLNFSNMVPDAKAKLAERVTQAIAQSPPQDTEDIQLAGQVINYQLGKMADTALVDCNVNGSTDAINGNRSLTISIRSTNTAPVTTPVTEPWTPDVGPLGVTGKRVTAPLSKDA